MKEIRKYCLPICIALIQWLINIFFAIDRQFFQFDGVPPKRILIKAVYLILLMFFWSFVFDFYQKVRAGDLRRKRGIRIFVVYFSVCLIILLIVWPGIWSWDDLRTLSVIRNYSDFFAWQHVITGFYQDILLQVIPSPAGLILLQNFLISMIVAYFVVTMETIFHIKQIRYPWLDYIVKVLPFLLPPILAYQFSGYRMGLYVYCELLVITMLLRLCLAEQPWSWCYIFFFCIMGAIVTTWRTESIFYAVAICVMVIVAKKEILCRNKKIVTMILFLIAFLSIHFWQKISLGNDDYQIVSFLRPCVELVRVADPVKDAEEMTELERVVSVEVIKEYAMANGEELYWKGIVVRAGYTKEDYAAFIKAVLQLSLKYPRTVINERTRLAKESLGIAYSFVTNIPKAAMLYEEENEFAKLVFQKNSFGEKPIFQMLRKRFIYMLGCSDGQGYVCRPLFRIVWNVMIPIWIMIYAGCKLLIKRKWDLLVLWGAVVVRIPIVLVTQPSGWIMYLLSFYFMGYVYFVYRILIRSVVAIFPNLVYDK